MNQLTKLTAVLGLDASGFKRGLSDAGNDMDSFGGKAGKGANAVGLAVAGMGAAAVVGIGASIAAAAGFEKQIDAVGAVAQASAGQMDQLSDAALRIGKDTAYSASEAASAMEILAANGLTVEQILGGAADATVALAAAGGTTLSVAADVASTAMKVWGLQGEELVDVVNRVAGAANVSRFGVEDMSQAIAMGGGVAAAFGVNFQDFSTAIAASADLFASGSDAGTSFKTMLQKMVSPAGEGAKAIAGLGLNFHNAAGELKTMPEIAGELNRVFADMRDVDRDKYMSDIFGTDGIRAAIGLMRQGEDGFTQMSATMGATDASAIAAQRMGNFNGALESLKGTIETLMIQFGTAFLPILTKVALYLSENLPAAITAIVAGLKPFVETARALGAALQEYLAPALAAINEKLGPFLTMLSENQAVMTAVGIIIGTVLVAAFVALAVSAGAAAIGVIAALAPFLAIAIAVGALIAVIVLLVQHWDEITAKFPILAEATEVVKEAVGGLVDYFVAEFLPTITRLVTDIAAAGMAIIGFVRAHWEEIKGIIDAVLTIIVHVLEAQFKFIVQVVEGAMKILSGIIDLVMGLITGDWDRAWEGIKSIAEGVWQIISGAAELFMDMLHTFVVDGLGLIKAVWALVWDVIEGKVKSIISAITGAVSGFMSDIKEKISGALDTIKGLWTEAWDSLAGLVTGAASYVVLAVVNLVNGIVSTIRDWFGSFYSLGRELIENVGNGIASMAGWISQKASDAVSAAKSAMNPKNWVGSPKGLQNWYPYYLGLGMDAMEAEAASNDGAVKAAGAITEDLGQGLLESQYVAEKAALGLADRFLGVFEGGNWQGRGRSIGEDAALDMLGGWTEAFEPLDDIVSKFVDEVVASGDYMNDWLSHMPEGAARAARIWGEQFAGMKDKTTANLDAVKDSLVSFGTGTTSILDDQIRTWKWFTDASAYELATWAGTDVTSAMEVAGAAAAGWTRELKFNLEQGRDMNTDVISGMFEDMNRLIQESNLEGAAKQEFQALQSAMMDGFRQTGSLSNTAVIDLFDKISAGISESTAAAGVAMSGLATQAQSAGILFQGAIEPLPEVVAKFVDEVIASGDYMNDWLSHMPEGAREAAQIWGEQFASMEDKTVANLDAVRAALAAFGQETANAIQTQIQQWKYFQDASSYELANAGVDVTSKAAIAGAAQAAWSKALGDNLAIGKSMNENEISDMLEDMNKLIMDSGMADSMKQQFQAMESALMDGFKQTGSLSNVAMMNLFSQIQAAAQAALNPGNWVGSPRGLQNWFPYYLGLGLDNMLKEARQNSSAMAAASVISERFSGPWGGQVDGWGGALPTAATRPAGALVGAPGGEIQVNQNGPVYIYATDPEGGQAAKRDWSYSAAAQLRARGVA